MEIKQEEYKILKELDDKWEWLMKENDESMFVYDKNPDENWSNPDGKSKHISIKKGLFDDIPNDEIEYVSISKMIDEYETRKTLEKFFQF